MIPVFVRKGRTEKWKYKEEERVVSSLGCFPSSSSPSNSYDEIATIGYKVEDLEVIGACKHRCVVCALQNLFSLCFAEENYKEELYHYLVHELCIAPQNLHPTENSVVELLVVILEFLHCWRSPYKETLTTFLFTVEEFERMSCNTCKQKPKYPKEHSYGLVVCANSIREIKVGSSEEDYNCLANKIRDGFGIHLA